MFFSYGFIDSDSVICEFMIFFGLIFDDLFGRVKIYVYGKFLIVKLFVDDGIVYWESGFMYLMCLNEEDGLDFCVL